MIDVHDLVFEYPAQRALDTVSFTVEANAVAALVGPNGAGKTTLMRCLCGLERPVSGSIVIDGIDVIDQPRLSHERLGYLSDFFGLYDELSVSRCLSYAAMANGMTRDIAHAVALTAQRLGIEKRLEHRVEELSRGLRQRVAIGQAIIHSPKVLVLDEPASGLDPEARHDLASLFKLLRASGMTLLVSSHILAELEEYATEMLLIREGRILEQRQLGARAEAGRKIVIELSKADSNATEWLRRHPDVHSIETDGERIVCELSGGDATQQRLLKQMIESDIAVLNFRTAAPDLQSAYLESIVERSLPQ